MTSYRLTQLPGHYAVCLLPPDTPVPTWANRGDFCAITRTEDELSIMCAQESVPADTQANLTVARDWVLLRVEGPFDFDVIGVLAALSTLLANAGVVLLAVATYQTDYLLVKAEQLEIVMAALAEGGHSIST